MVRLFRGTFGVLFAGLVLITFSSVLANAQNGPAAVQVKGRPGLAIRVDVQEKEAKLTIALDYFQSKKYVYTRAETDRQENGAVSIMRQAPDVYQIVGIYHYLEQLFVIDAVLKSGDRRARRGRKREPS